MLFYRDETIEDPNARCPICGGELQPSFLLPVLHDFGTATEYLLVTFLVMFLSFLGVHQLMVLLNIDYSAYPTVDWDIVAKITLVVCLNIGLIVAHFLTKHHLTIMYWATGLALKEARACSKCGNRFLVLQEENQKTAEDTRIAPPAEQEKT